MNVVDPVVKTHSLKIQAPVYLFRRAVRVVIKLLPFQVSEEALRNRIVCSSTFTIHTNGDLVLLKQEPIVAARKMAALITI
jgi:hypothetical protein